MRTLVLLALLLSAATAYAEDTDDCYYAYYGDGIRAYAESRYDDALTNLYRALAVKQTPYALKLIVRAHDFQGNCSARDRSVAMLRDAFPNASAPPPQRCTRTGELVIECAPNTGRVRVDGAFDAPCGAPLRVPIGAHDIEHVDLGVAVRVSVENNRSTVASLTLRPGKWYLDDRHKQVVELPERWLRPGLLVDPDMPRTFEWKRPGRTDR